MHPDNLYMNFYPERSMDAVIKKDIDEEYRKDITCNTQKS